MSLKALCVGRFFLPASGDSLPLSVELNCALAVEVGDAPHAGLVAREREHGKGDGNRQVDSDLTGFDFSLEFTSSVSIACEDS